MIEMPDTVDEFLTLCELARWARERTDHPTLAERLEDDEWRWENAS